MNFLFVWVDCLGISCFIKLSFCRFRVPKASHFERIIYYTYVLLYDFQLPDEFFVVVQGPFLFFVIHLLSVDFSMTNFRGFF